jgi:hypothetical protein
MNIYFSPYKLPELKNLTAEQRRGVVRRYCGDRYFVFAALAGGIGSCVALIMSDVLYLSHWPKAVLMVVLYLCGHIAFCHYDMKRLRPKIADYVFIHFCPKSA